MWDLQTLKSQDLEQAKKEMLSVLEQVHTAIAEGRFSEAGQLLDKVKGLINSNNLDPSPRRTKAGWGQT
jgi:hypothetical protein